jgi:hypothetical protein
MGDKTELAPPCLGEALRRGTIVNPDYLPDDENPGVKPLTKTDSKKVKLFTSPRAPA